MSPDAGPVPDRGHEALFGTLEGESLDAWAQYRAELDRQPEPLSREEEAELARRARAGDQKAKQKLVTANLPFVIFAAQHFMGRGLDLPELVSAGNAGLVRAADRYDPDRGVKFISYAVWWIRQAIREATRREPREIRIPATAFAERGTVVKAARRLEKRLGRRPTHAEVSNETCTDIGRVRALLGPSTRSLDSLNRPLHDEQGSTLGELTASPGPSPEEAALDEATLPALERALEETCTERERTILVLYFALDEGEPMTLEQIGEVLGVTRERVRQIRNASLEALREHPAVADLADLQGRGE